MIAESVVCGPDMDRHVEELRAYADAGVDEVYVQQIGPATRRASSPPTASTCCRTSTDAASA